MKQLFVNRYRLMLVLIMSMLMVGAVFASAQINEEKFDGQENKIACFDTGDTISITMPIRSYEIRNNENGQEIFVEDFGRLSTIGKPNLPSKIFAVAIPPGTKLVEVNYDVGEGITLPETYEISPVPIPRVAGDENPVLYEQDRQKYDENYDSTYTSNDPYPQNNVEFVRTAGYRKYNLVDVRVTPFTYYPLSNQLIYYPEITVHVSYSLPEGNIDLIVDNLLRTERTAEDIIINYDQAKNWYPGGTIAEKGLHDFVVITLDSLTSSITSLTGLETYKGRNVEVVTTTWIDSYYNGYDLAEKMRNFLIDKYPQNEWGIEDVLLVGDYDDVPMRRCWQDLGYGKPDTDLYYAELSLPDDESWDADGDHRWGENYDDPIDFYSEINVGRIPWSTPTTVEDICEKSVTYEQNNDPTFKKNILLLGAFFWPDTDNAVLMEYKVDSDIHPWMSDWIMTRMYEQGYSQYPMDYNLNYNNVKSVWSSGKYAFVNWAGHGSPMSCHIYYQGAPQFVDNDMCPYLNDDYPAIIFADACSNSDTDYLNIGKAMLKKGAVGFLGATKVAYGMPGWSNPNHGSSQSLDYYFTTGCTSGEYSQGESHQLSLRTMYTHGLWYDTKYEMFEWGALWGNPNLGMAPVGDSPLIQIGDITSDLMNLHVDISNEGDAEATNVEWSITIKGGILGLINAISEGIIPSLDIGEEVTVQTDQAVFGLGPVEIIVSAGTTMKDAQGFVIGPFILL